MFINHLAYEGLHPRLILSNLLKHRFVILDDRVHLNVVCVMAAVLINFIILIAAFTAFRLGLVDLVDLDDILLPDRRN